MKDKPSLGLIPTSILLPNAIAVVQNTGKEYYFSQFTSRKETYDLLIQLWTIAVDGLLHNVELSSGEVKRKQFSTVFQVRIIIRELSSHFLAGENTARLAQFYAH